MKALKSDNLIYALINANFVIKVYDFVGVVKSVPVYAEPKLTTARKLSDFIDDEMKNKLFERALNGKDVHYVFKIRNRLKIKFHGK